MAYAPLELAKAIYATLSADATLTSMLTLMPNNQRALYNGLLPTDLLNNGGDYAAITVGDDTGTDEDDKSVDGWEIEVPVDIWYRDNERGGWLGPLNIAARVYDLLHHQSDTLNPVMTDVTCYLIRRVSENKMIDPDGITRHIQLGFIANLKEC